MCVCGHSGLERAHRLGHKLNVSAARHDMWCETCVWSLEPAEASAATVGELHGKHGSSAMVHAISWVRVWICTCKKEGATKRAPFGVRCRGWHADRLRSICAVREQARVHIHRARRRALHGMLNTMHACLAQAPRASWLSQVA